MLTFVCVYIVIFTVLEHSSLKSLANTDNVILLTSGTLHPAFGDYFVCETAPAPLSSGAPVNGLSQLI